MSTCFVDFQNASESVRPDSLKHKLEQLGIKVNFLDLITSLYSSTKVSLFLTFMSQTHAVHLEDCFLALQRYSPSLRMNYMKN